MDSDSPTVISIPSSISTASPTAKKDSSASDGSLFGKTRYKFWVLSAILLLAFWSMFTGSVTLKWSTGNLTHFSDDHNFPLHDDDLDILEVEEKEQLVKHMWDIYTHSSSTKLPKFWQEAFEAAYESLLSDVSSVRDAAVSEIAKMSLRSFNPDPLSIQSSDQPQPKGKRNAAVANEGKRSNH